MVYILAQSYFFVAKWWKLWYYLILNFKDNYGLIRNV